MYAIRSYYASPVSGETVSGIVTISGTLEVYGDRTIDSIQIQIDYGDWIVLEPSASWSYDWNTVGLENGNHDIIVKGTDSEGLENSDIISVIVANE